MAELENAVLVEIRRLAVEELALDAPVTLADRLKEDLQLDSMAMVVVATQLENRFRVRLDEQDAGELATIQDLVRLVARRVREARPS